MAKLVATLTIKRGEAVLLQAHFDPFGAFVWDATPGCELAEINPRRVLTQIRCAGFTAEQMPEKYETGWRPFVRSLLHRIMP